MLTQYSSVDKRRVYLAYRTVFAGPNAQLRKHKKVREVIQARQNAFRPLINDFGLEKIIEIVIILLNGRIFQSELKAKIAFPELFRTTPSRDVQRAETENDAVRSEAEALEDLLSADDADERGDNRRDENKDEDGADGKLSNNPCSSLPGCTDYFSMSTVKPASTKVPSLYPLYLPYKIQHLILTTAQHQLEECCFEFAAKWLPSLLEDNNWDCAEAVELTKWTRTLAKRYDKILAYAINNESKTSLEDVFFSTNVLRYTAVHRLSTSAKGIHKMIQSASRLATALGDHPRAAQLKRLHLEIESRLRDMEINKNFLENRLDEQLRGISEQRAELHRMEQEAIATMLKDDQENKILIGSFLEASCREAFEMDDIMQVETVIDRSQTDSDENNDD